VPKYRIKKDDTVVVLTGKDQGKTGKVLKVIPEKGRLVVERANFIKRHTRASQTAKGGILEKEAPLSISNVKLVCPACGKPTRVGRRTLAEGRTVRYCKKCGDLVDK
jgi:large subunit ribosomal protein L24